ncbi:HlyD family secretion protein [Chondrocystis sp. NIES-4102]|nr:HlyD family secretion protein [Chondrocystis sp. NIES-4102]
MSYSESPITISNGRSKATLRILIVDNQGDSSQHLGRLLLSEPNITVVGVAKNILETFEIIPKVTPDVVIIDIDVPAINSYNLIRRINNNFPKIKIIVLTEENQSNQINQALSLGAKGFILKNCQIEEIRNTLYTLTCDHSDDTKLQLPVEQDPEPVTAISKYNSSALAVVPVTNNNLPVLVAEREDWSGATKDLLDALPRLWTRGLLYFLIISTGIIVPWSVLTKVDETGTARGRLEPKDQVIRLDAPVAGKIAEINVKEGDVVKKGAILAQLGSEVANTELEQLQAKVSGLQTRLGQLELMKSQSLTTLDTKEQETQSRLQEKESQIKQAQQNFDTLQALYESQKGEKQAQIEQAKQEINSSIAARKEAEVALTGAQEKAKRYQLAFKQGVIAQDRFLDVQQEAKQNQERLAQATSALEQAKLRLKEQENSYQNLIKKSAAEIEQAKLRLEEQQSSDQTLASSGKLEQLQTKEGIQEIESQITTVTSEIAQTEKEIQSSKFELKQRELIAPGDGTVFHILAKGKGTVVQPGERMIEIAPKNSTLILKAQIPPTDSGFIKQGMPVKIKFDAYPFQDYGVNEGTLISISPDSKVTETSQGQVESYEIKVALDQPYIIDQGKRIALTPGQTATAEIIIRQRRVIDFFLDPFRKLQKDGIKL